MRALAPPVVVAARKLGASFADRLVTWQRTHGRRTLPWQNTRDPYRVWLSEIMLQQTQVATVLGYYERFLVRFPSVRALAAAPEDDVLGLWSGLGYYSRARNLHRCAQEVVDRFDGAFPSTAEELATLPGIGRSTAAAIAAFCFGERVAILDGNVQRVLGRVLAFEGDLSSAGARRELWEAATALLPPTGDPADIASYTQGLMDLGATVCLPRQPNCLLCPVQTLCRARLTGPPERFPVKTRKLRRSAQSLWLLMARRDDDAVWLEKRPARGIWAGLYALPAFDSDAALRAGCMASVDSALIDLPPFVHVLTHKDLHLHPVEWRCHAATAAPVQTPGQWVSASDWPALGLPAPIRRLLTEPPGAGQPEDEKGL